MTAEQIIGLLIALTVMLMGVAGSILPGLPGTPIVLVGAIGHKLYFKEDGVAWWVLLILGILTAASLIVDYLASIYGAKRMGATWRGAVGAIVGGLVGLFFNLPGILLGPFLGAMVFEVAGGREWKDASRAGVGATLGLLAGTLGKLLCCLLMIGLFTSNAIYRSIRFADPVPPALEADRTDLRLPARASFEIDSGVDCFYNDFKFPQADRGGPTWAFRLV